MVGSAVSNRRWGGVLASPLLATLFLWAISSHAAVCVVPTADSSPVLARLPRDAKPEIVVTAGGIVELAKGGQQIPVRTAPAGQIHSAARLAGVLFLGMDSGLYKMESDEQVVLVARTTAPVVEIQPGTDLTWYSTDEGIYRLVRNGEPTRIPLVGARRVQVTHYGAYVEGFGMDVSAWVMRDGKVIPQPKVASNFRSSSSTPQGLRLLIDSSGSRILLPNGKQVPRSGAATGAIDDAGIDGFGVLVTAERGVFAVSDQGAMDQVGGLDVGKVKGITYVNDDLIVIQGTKRLARRIGVRELGALPGADPGEVHDIQITGQGILVTSDKGLFRISPKGVVEPLEGVGIGATPRLHVFDDDVLVSTGKALLRLSDGQLVSIAGIDGFPLLRVEREGHALLVQMTDRWFAVRGNLAVRIPADAGSVSSVFSAGEAFLVESKQGVFLLDTQQRLTPISGSLPETVRVVEKVGSDLLLGTRKGLFRIASDRTIKEVAGAAGKEISAIADAGDTSNAYVRTGSGVDLYIHKSLTGDEVAFDSIGDGPHLPGADLQAAWHVLPEKNPCIAVDGALKPVATLIPDGGTGIHASIMKPEDAKAGVASVYVPGTKLTQGGKYALEITMVDTQEPADSKTFRSSPFVVDSDVLHILLRAMDVTLIVTFALGILGSCALLAGSRRYRWCFEFLAGNRWEALKIWYRPIIYYVRPLRLWMLGAFFHRLQQQLLAESARAGDAGTPSDHYLPVDLLEKGKPVLRSDKMLAELKPGKAAWVQGEAGTGKSELVQLLERRFYLTPTWREAIRTFGFMPIVISVRDYPDTPDTPDAPWVAEVARHRFSSVQLAVEDASFFYRLLKCGDIAIVLDGLNEVDRDAAVQRYCNTAGHGMRLLVTSQSLPRAWDVRTLNLPLFDRPLIRKLLANLLGKAIGEKVDGKMSESLGASLRSGYDVQLISQCVSRDHPLPATRLELYDMAYESALSGLEEAEAFDAALGETAWNMLLAGARRFSESTALTGAMLGPFVAANVVVLRPASYEFRHDLMRAYVAARHVVRLQPGIRNTASLLESQQLWSGSAVRIGDRRELLAFVCAMITSPDDLFKLKDVAQADIESRATLFAAAQKVAAERSWDWERPSEAPLPSFRAPVQ